MPMRPYKKERRSALLPFNGPVALQRLVVYLTPFYTDLRAIWRNDPPFPISIKLAVSCAVATLLALPVIFFLLVVPLATLVCFQTILGAFCPYDLTQTPVYAWAREQAHSTHLTSREHEVFYNVVKQVMRKTSVKISILVASYDYLQTLRALGMDLADHGDGAVM